MIRIEQVRHQNRAFDLVSVTMRTMSSRSSPHQPGADFSNEAAVDRRPSAARDLEALAMRALAREGAVFAAGLLFPRFLSSRCFLLEIFNILPPRVRSDRSSCERQLSFICSVIAAPQDFETFVPRSPRCRDQARAHDRRRGAFVPSCPLSSWANSARPRRCRLRG